MNRPTEFGALLAGLRKRAGLTQVDLADVVGLSRTNIIKWEGGSKPPRRAVCDQLAEALGVSPDMLWRVAAWERIGADERLVVEAKFRRLRALAAVSHDDADVDAELSLSSIKGMLKALHPDILPGLLNVLRALPSGAALSGVSHKELVQELSRVVEMIEDWPPAATYTAINSCLQLIESVAAIRVQAVRRS